ncbi:RNAse P Rpr2/Rpp21/SNM1 subunit domain-containing protein [Scheffersomyces amazonensis]|uniref:RNAse P Rpr2/Rpp21/SNM1 subunit domain-containing protein n=1 Tax=Scheffersomyces amazonensis TaxID=1078765 RepID=UPI00315C6104
MGKGKGNNKPGSKIPSTVPQKDHYSRISYLLNATNHFTSSSKYNILSRGYARNLDLVAKKTVIKLTPALKRSLCKKCNTFLIPGLTLTVFIENESKSKASHNDVLVHQCLYCHSKKRFPIGSNRDYVVFSERDDVKVSST